MKERADFLAILDQVPNGARILEIGCANGDLLLLLQNERNAIVRGLEISQEGVNACVAKGLSVIQGDADKDLSLFPDKAFDLVILSNTIQATMNPKAVLMQIQRIGRRAIVSLPNFAYWRARLSLLFKGKMPVTEDLPDTWYETQNIHLCTLHDFAELAQSCGFSLHGIMSVNGDRRGAIKKSANNLMNWTAQKAVFILES